MAKTSVSALQLLAKFQLAVASNGTATAMQLEQAGKDAVKREYSNPRERKENESLTAYWTRLTEMSNKSIESRRDNLRMKVVSCLSEASTLRDYAAMAVSLSPATECEVPSFDECFRTVIESANCIKDLTLIVDSSGNRLWFPEYAKKRMPLTAVQKLLVAVGLEDEYQKILSPDPVNPGLNDKGERLEVLALGSKFVPPASRPQYNRSKFMTNSQVSQHRRDKQLALLMWQERAKSNRIITHDPVTESAHPGTWYFQTGKLPVYHRILPVSQVARQIKGEIFIIQTAMEYSGDTCSLIGAVREVKRKYKPINENQFKLVKEKYGRKYLADISVDKDGNRLPMETIMSMLPHCKMVDNVIRPNYVKSLEPIGKYPEYDQKIKDYQYAVPQSAVESVRTCRKESIHGKPPVTTIEHSSFARTATNGKRGTASFIPMADDWKPVKAIGHTHGVSSMSVWSERGSVRVLAV